jgi:hypothetical protein
VRDVLRLRVLRADRRHAGIGGFAGLAERVVAGVEVLAFLTALVGGKRGLGEAHFELVL